jgi:hypothetical protein
VVVVEGVIANPVVGAITMIAIGILLNILGLGIFCRTLFGLATNALPTFFGLTAGLYVYQAGTDPVGATVFGAVAGAIVLVLGQFVFTLLRVPILRVAIALTFAVPAAFAGYQAAYELSGHTMTSDLWRNLRHRRRRHSLGTVCSSLARGTGHVQTATGGVVHPDPA